MMEEVLNRVELRAVCRRREADDDLVFCDCHLAGCSEDVCKQPLRLAGPAHVLRDDSGELGLSVRAYDADDVDDGLELASVSHELVREKRLLDRSMRRDLWPQRDEIVLPLEGQVEFALDLL